MPALPLLAGALPDVSMSRGDPPYQRASGDGRPLGKRKRSNREYAMHAADCRTSLARERLAQAWDVQAAAQGEI